MGLLRWGLIPSWAKDKGIGSRMINARAETVSEKPAFKRAFQRRRCLVPADGFFEWKRGEIEGAAKGAAKGAAEGAAVGAKTPHWIHLAEGKAFAMAGLWEQWNPGEAASIYTFTILTTEAAPEIREIHHRMPVFLSASARDMWLDPGAAPQDLLPLLRPYLEGIQAHPVSTLVNSPRNDVPECIEML